MQRFLENKAVVEKNSEFSFPFEYLKYVPKYQALHKPYVGMIWVVPHQSTLQHSPDQIESK